MARASAAALNDFSPLSTGVRAVVFGTMVSRGLSSSASVILAYLSALAAVNDITLSEKDLVELSRRVENDYRGLNNGIQDQMSIVFGQQDHLTLLDVESVSARLAKDPSSISDYQFLMCYSGVSRDLAGSGFNTRVSECKQAASLLHGGASHLGQVPLDKRQDKHLKQLPEMLARRAKHVYTEMRRVQDGVDAWSNAEFELFGQLMNQSCQSSIYDYESGSEWLIALHDMARDIDGVYGNRFSGGGYGGCLFMLVDASKIEDIAASLMDQYLARYPDLKGSARVLIAESESSVRTLLAH